MKNLYSATEIAKMKLKGLPKTRANISIRAQKEGWYFELRTGRGGESRVYEVPAHYFAEEIANAEITDNKQCITKKMFSAAEIAAMNLLGLPRSKGKVISKAMSEGWPFEYRTGIGGKRRVYEVPAHYLGGTEAKEAGQPINRQETAKPAVARAVAGGQQANLAFLQQVDTILEEVLQEKEVKLLPQRRGTVLAFLYDCVTKGVDLERLKAALQALLA